MARRHHVVSKGYQRAFADGERILLIDKATEWARPVGVADAFVVRGFNTRRHAGGEDEELEDEWARLEQAAIPVVRAVAAGADVDDRADMELKVLIAVHFARSFAVRRVHDAAVAAKRLTPLEDMDLPKLHAVFERQYGRSPNDGELEAIALHAMDERFGDNQFFIEQMVRFHNLLLDFLREKHLQVVRVPEGPVQFVTGDTPVVRTAGKGLRVNVAIRDADLLYFPIGRWCAVALSTQPLPTIEVNRVVVAHLNSLVWRSALRQVACHPGADWKRCLARTSS